MMRIEGTEVRVRGDRVIVLPPLTVKVTRRATKDGRLALVQTLPAAGLPTDEQWDAVASLVRDALECNYPGISQDEVEEFLDFGNMTDVVTALFKRSGFREVPKGEAPSPSNGTTSYPTSAP